MLACHSDHSDIPSLIARISNVFKSITAAITGIRIQVNDIELPTGKLAHTLQKASYNLTGFM
jgi:hypothetical protein